MVAYARISKVGREKRILATQSKKVVRLHMYLPTDRNKVYRSWSFMCIPRSWAPKFEVHTHPPNTGGQREKDSGDAIQKSREIAHV